jgi:hypothetical protein
MENKKETFRRKNKQIKFYLTEDIQSQLRIYLKTNDKSLQELMETFVELIISSSDY